MFAQGNLCFFCDLPLAKENASVEHLVASANGGANSDDNCVACCKAVNAMFGRMSLKEKLRVVLNQRGNFKCPNGTLQKATKPSQAQRSPAYVKVHKSLKANKSSRPGTPARLRSTVLALLATDDVAVADAVILELTESGVVRTVGKKTSYKF
jgi:hypothetical protein